MNILTMTHNDVIDIVEYSKLLKADIVYITGNMIYGADNTFTILKHIPYSNPYNLSVTFSIKDMMEMFKIASDYEISTVFNQPNIYVAVNKGEHIYQFNHLISSIINITNVNSVSISITEFSNNDKFIEASKLKADEGIILIPLYNEYILTMYKNLVPANKGDVVDLYIHDIIHDSNIFLARYITNKKKPKGLQITTYIIYLKIK
ncbi:MAG: hypothetical protein ACRCXT_18245 [Paraclostridium sp.]